MCIRLFAQTYSYRAQAQYYYIVFNSLNFPFAWAHQNTLLGLLLLLVVDVIRQKKSFNKNNNGKEYEKPESAYCCAQTTSRYMCCGSAQLMGEGQKEAEPNEKCLSYRILCTDSTVAPKLAWTGNIRRARIKIQTETVRDALCMCAFKPPTTISTDFYSKSNYNNGWSLHPTNTEKILTLFRYHH